MSLRKNTIYKLFTIIINLCIVFGDGIWVKHGWELFDYIIDAKSAALGNAVTAYNIQSVQSSIANPFFFSKLSIGNDQHLFQTLSSGIKID